MVIRKIAVDIVKKNNFLKMIARKLMYFKRWIMYKTNCLTNKIDENVIIFESFMGRTYSDNPRAMYEEMINNTKYKNFKFIWMFKNPDEKRNIEELSKATLIKYESMEYFKYYSIAKYLVSNSRIPEAIKPRNGQVYVQTWHGTPLKKLGYDLTAQNGNALNSLKDVRYKYKTDAEKYSYLLSPSDFCTEKLTSCFNLKENNPNCKIIQEGYPRNDFLSNYKEDDVKNIKEKLDINNIGNKKIILYAPTWRDNQHTSGVGYTYKIDVDFDLLRENLEDKYIILFRAHYLVANSFDFEKYKGFIYDVSSYESINDLYIVADILITDYSSVFFDFAILKRPMIFYMYDLKEYKEDIHGFYIDLKELPGKIVENENALLKEIKEVTNNFKYNEKYQQFNNKYNPLDDGNVSKRVLKKIIDIKE